MAPPKTIALSQQHQQSVSVGQTGDPKLNPVKPRKRKGKQQPQQRQQSQESQEDDFSEQSRANGKQNNIEYLDRKVGNNDSKKKSVYIAPKNPVVPSERTTVTKTQNKSQNSKSKPEPVAGVKRSLQPSIDSSVVVATPAIAKQKQHLVNDEADDIDAGIELDGSSNSGSSVKDIGEDQKSASVSPVMAQTSSIAAENINSCNVRSQTAEVTPLDKLEGSVCTNAKLTTTDEPEKVKKASATATKQQLAANQQVIDADEQQLQLRLQNKQKKPVSQDSGASLDDNSLIVESITKKTQDTSVVTNLTKVDKTKVKPRRFSSQSSQESQDNLACKICGQHVYQMEKLLAEKSIYHKGCFRCHQCKIQLRVDNYSSHEGQVYCKAHHRQIFQPRVNLDSGDDVDIVAKSNPASKTVDDYLLHRGRLSELSFSFLLSKPQELLKRQMIICENEPAELPKDVVRCDTKIDDGIGQLNLNLNNILEKFERGNASGEESQSSSASIVIDKPSYNIRKTLMAFESKSNEIDDESLKRSERSSERPTVRKLTNFNGFLNQNSQDGEPKARTKPLPVKRSDSLMLRLKKYESRIAGESVDDDFDCSDNENNNNEVIVSEKANSNAGRSKLDSLKNQWENGDINRRRDDDSDDSAGHSPEDDKIDGTRGNLSGEKSEELFRIRQQLARRKSGESQSVRNIYENAIKEAQQQQKQMSSRRDSNDLSALNGFSTNDIQQQLLKQTSISQKPSAPKKDYQLNFSKKANKLKEKFELGLINNSSRDDSDHSDDEDAPISKLEQLRQEKLEDLSIFTEGEIKTREARNLFQQIDKRISAANGGAIQSVVTSRSLASVQDAMQNKLTSKMTSKKNITQASLLNDNSHQQDSLENRPIRLTNNVRM